MASSSSGGYSPSTGGWPLAAMGGLPNSPPASAGFPPPPPNFHQPPPDFRSPPPGFGVPPGMIPQHIPIQHQPMHPSLMSPPATGMSPQLAMSLPPQLLQQQLATSPPPQLPSMHPNPGMGPPQLPPPQQHVKVPPGFEPAPEVVDEMPLPAAASPPPPLHVQQGMGAASPPPPPYSPDASSSCSSSTTASHAISIPKAIPSHVMAEAASPPEMSFSPSKLSTSTIDTFNHEEESGVPLQTAWTFWLDRPVHNASMAEYKASLKKIYTVSTVQGFWSVFHHIPQVWELKLRTYYHLMREEKEPLWEDPSLAKGGVWRIKCPKRETSRVWKELLLAAIGEQFCDEVHDGDDVCGLSVSPREKDDLIQIWNVRSEDVGQSRVLDKVHQLLPDVRFNAEFYKPHQTHSAFEGARSHW